MTQPKQLDPYSSPRTFYGSELRRLREGEGWSQDQLGERVFCSGTYIGQLESATRRPQPDLSKMLDGELESGEHLQRLCELARKSKHADYFADAAELERRAKTISEYSSMLVPGLLQTEDYARALIRAAQRFEPQSSVDRWVKARLERQRILENSTGPVLWTVLHEAVLRLPVGGRKTMHEQLTSLCQRIRSNHRMVVQVLPFSAGEQAFLNGTTILMTFADAPPATYTEGAFTGQLIEDPTLVGHYQRAYDLTRAASLSPDASLSLIESAAKDYATQ